MIVMNFIKNRLGPLLAFGATLAMAPMLSANETTPRQTLKQELNYLSYSIQPLLPMVIDDSTQLIAAQASTDTFIRTFKIFVPLTEIDTHAFTVAMQPALTSYVCDTENQKPLLELGGKHQFVYLAMPAEIFADITIDQAQCDR